MVDAIRGQAGERIEPPLEPARGRHQGALRRDVVQMDQVRAIVAGQRPTLDLGPERAATRARDLQQQVDAALPLDRVDQAGEPIGSVSAEARMCTDCPTSASAARPISRAKAGLA